jgi:hypothetical protein
MYMADIVINWKAKIGKALGFTEECGWEEILIEINLLDGVMRDKDLEIVRLKNELATNDFKMERDALEVEITPLRIIAELTKELLVLRSGANRK